MHAQSSLNPPHIRRALKRALGLALVLTAAACGAASHNTELPVVASSAARTSNPAAVAMPDTFSAEAASQILRQGGNAVDAAVTATFVLAVTLPEAGNIAGGGLMVTYVNGKADYLDYRETAPAGSSRDMYLDPEGNVVPGLSTVGHLASGVPGTVEGMWAVHQKYGTLPWATLLAPAIKLAAEGFAAPPPLAQHVLEELPTFEGKTNFARYFQEVKAGQRFTQPELAQTLQRIADQGPDGFYRGKTADLIVAEMKRGGGLITHEDLAGYASKWRPALSAPWRGYEIYSAGPPSSGGFAVVQLLVMKDHLRDKFAGLAHNSAQYIHLVAEMEKRVFADRAEYLGDSDHVSVPIDRLMDLAYIKQRADEVQSNRISVASQTAPGLESPDTTHFSIVDAQGNAVSNTYTLNTQFGCGVVVEGGGFLLNNEMDDFAARPGVPNAYGVYGSEANAIAPNKRMLSSMSPTILVKDGKVRMVVGTPGGSTIFTSVFQTIVNIMDFGMTPQEAAAATRFHHQLIPNDLVVYSPGLPLPDSTIAELVERGWRAEPHFFEFGDVQVIVIDEGGVRTGSDPRGRGTSTVLR